jgi:hypothetical protein
MQPGTWRAGCATATAAIQGGSTGVVSPPKADVVAASQLGVDLAQRGEIAEGRRWLAAAAREGDENAIRNLEILDRLSAGRG